MYGSKNLNFGKEPKEHHGKDRRHGRHGRNGGDNHYRRHHHHACALIPVLLVLTFVSHLVFIRKYAAALDAFIADGGKIKAKWCKKGKKDKKQKKEKKIAAQQSPVQRSSNVIEYSICDHDKEEYPQVSAPTTYVEVKKTNNLI